MSDIRKNLKQAVKDYYSVKSLSSAQISTLQMKQRQLQTSIGKTSWKLNNNYHKKPWLATVAASFIVFIIAFAYMKTPPVISDAYVDIRRDDNEFNGLQASLVKWLDANKIAAVPEQYKIEMSKICQLGTYQTRHLRIAGVQQGKLHLFFHQGDKPLYWLKRSGVMSNMNRRLVKVRDDLMLIVMYTQDMREKAIKHILGEMLPDLQA